MVDSTQIRLAADIGGTFTDVVLQTPQERLTRKVLTTPSAPEQGVMDGIGLVIQDASLQFPDVTVFVHGTTLATNAIIERRGARTALIGTQGFRDILEIGTESRFNQYDLMLQKPSPLVSRDLRFTVPERMDARGTVQLPLDEAAVLALVPRLREAGVESIAVAFLHAYANPAHEQRVRALLQEALPDVTISISSEVCPEIREYERTSTTVANAYVQPLMAGYLGRLREALNAKGFQGALYLVTSGGGLTALETARQFPVRLVESGPAGGAIFAAQCAERLGENRVLSFDMGGTTAKVCLIEDGEPASSRFFEVDRTARFMKGSGLPLRIPVIEMVEIGAGGGSIAHLDAMKRVVVGPESASSVPGPACYGLGGKRPAVTDADVMLGLIRPENFAGGSIQLQPDRSAEALLADIGTPLGLSAEMSAHAVYEIVCENMASAARVHAAERGAVIGDHTMIAFGGAAPLHAARVAEKLGIQRLVIPSNAGVGSAVGFLAAPVSFELVRSFPMRLDDSFNSEEVSALLDDMTQAAHGLVQDDARTETLHTRRSAFMRYVGQGHEIIVTLPEGAISSDHLSALRGAFEAEYARQFARVIPHAAVEILNWSVSVSTTPQKYPPFEAAPALHDAKSGDIRKLFDGATGTHVDLPVYERTDMGPGSRISGPALIAEKETTTYVSSRYNAHLDGSGNIILDMKDAV
ncbi:MAG: hydantoinase/oxoprolinase family protein [Gluconobacter potus]|uniref:Hydantoinase/oxoprolinase family protein n=1 Tax=Gluconobacter potus TaxID=2724927 RepID=A0ABR9YPY8_9PROT|nr:MULTISPECIES: hydantoinase/oxoprolinase family protein [Gluconobacter]MBF0865850.1 hydantoinase/oxoprolinase family protein [Gluconobacter sp. R71656]MBF0868938.1 hydantoinase/oxoprolinase family protein [Gluconobacter sp. R75628]MBF0874922.1 hydantoinase/oxoprolinase family protein [Gluconobacter sp. R75629]MBF0883851.1 hydantoinase/oxoprolinase family protein [Gluconobacter potus]